MKAVLLAAGRGSRLGRMEVPKPFAEIGPRGPQDAASVTILERQIYLLQEAGVTQIAVVIGYEQAKARELLAGKGVSLVVNTSPDLAISGTAHSFQFAVQSAFDALDGRTTCLLMDGDLVYERAVLHTALQDRQGSSLLVSPRVAGDAEEVRVYGTADRPRLIGKGLVSPVTDGLELIGEATGIVRFGPADHTLVRKLLDWLVGTPSGDGAFGFSGLAAEHEALCQYLITLGRLAAVRLAPDLLFQEIDFQEDLERARRVTYPRILEKESAAPGSLSQPR